MPSTLALVNIAQGIVLQLRIFINRNEIANKLKDADPVFETPLLSNNALVRLKSPFLRVHLSNEDTKNLCYELRDDLLFALYELASPALQDGLLKKLKVGGYLEFYDILNEVQKLSELKPGAINKDSPISGLNLHTTHIERLEKHKYKLHFKHNWEVDLVIADIRKLTKWRRLLLLRGNISSNNNPARGIGFTVPNNVPYVLIPKAVTDDPEEIPQESTSLADATDTTKDPVPNLLEESEDEIPESVEDDKEQQQASQDIKKKVSVKYKYSTVLNLGNLIQVHVLRRSHRNNRRAKT
ncbi:HEL070Wp [Eremothecium sinecaudum]|uniref:HEL070Wp n=1 Tax=Eremothecium sinecaudum TaxID=45286 RepID=A0A109UZC0_9SACH|nr:HEL070Wp [Eremothecium sinecaudum]AMD21210.1 HEL070Wp [Eremothecium sinecaudum]